MWIGLILFRVGDNRRIKQRQAIRDRWLERLMILVEDPSGFASLEKVRGKQEMETVLGLLRDLAERFRGQYRDQLGKVLERIGAEEYALSFLNRLRARSRVRGCALLAWLESNPATDARLIERLQDRVANVRLEACHALATRHSPQASIDAILGLLRGTEAIFSSRARDVIRLLAPGRSADLASALKRARSPRERELLIEGLAEAADFTQSAAIAEHLDDPNPLTRIAVVRALEQLGDPSFQTPVAALANDPDRRVRLVVAKYSASMAQSQDHTGTLEKLALDDDFDVQRTAIHALVKLNGERLDAFRKQSQPPLIEGLLMEATSSFAIPPKGAPR